MAHLSSLLCFFLLLFTFTFTFTYSKAQMVPAVFVFGDSLVDVGNNNFLKVSLAKANFPHNGIDFPTKKATGRFSNGKNAADLLAEKLGLPTSPPYLSVVSNKSYTFLGGVSFASGGAGIFNGTDELFKQSIPLDKQISYYSEVYKVLVEKLGSSGAQQYLTKSLFAVVIGSNDILGYFTTDSSQRKKATPQQFIDSMILALKGQLKRLYDLGGRKLAVVGAGVVGCCPSQRNQNKTGECNVEANYWSVKYNEGVKSVLQGLKSELKDIEYSLFDTYSLMLDFIQKPAQHGFTEVESACCGLGNLRAKVPCLPIAKYCADRNAHIFWDLYHPTEAASRILVDTFFDGSKQYVYPVNVRQLVSM